MHHFPEEAACPIIVQSVPSLGLVEQRAMHMSLFKKLLVVVMRLEQKPE